jgi:hypothetical protein
MVICCCCCGCRRVGWLVVVVFVRASVLLFYTEEEIHDDFRTVRNEDRPPWQDRHQGTYAPPRQQRRGFNLSVDDSVVVVAV